MRPCDVDITRAVPLALVPLLLTLLSGCGEDVHSTALGTPAAVPGEARNGLQCDAEVYRDGAGDYTDSGLETVEDDPAAAVRALVDQGYVGDLPLDGYSVVRREDDRALVTFDVDGRAKVALVVESGVTDWNGNEGWGVTSWAQCDPAELPEEVTEALGIGVWSDEQGERVPVSKVRSFDGPEHCDWQDIVFLHVGPEKDSQQYLRDTHGELADLERMPYAEDVRLPADAVDSGWRRDGRELWLVQDRSAAYLVAVGDRRDVERWPGTDGVACA